MLGIIIDLERGRTIEDTDKGPIVIWGACLIPIGRFDRHGETGYVVDVITMLDPTSIRHGVTLMATDTVGARFLGWCSQFGLPQPDGKNVRKIINGVVADPESSVPVTYVDSVGEIEPGLWALANGVVADGEFIPMERGTHRQTASGRRVVYAPSLTCDEECGPAPMVDSDGELIAEWASDLISMYGSIAPIICNAWIRASVLRSRIEAMDAQLPAIYICGDSHRGKTLMATIGLRMLGGKGERPHANMTSSSNAGVFLVAAMRSCLPFVMDEVKPYSGIHDNDLIKSLVNGDIPAKSTRSGRLRASTRVRSMPILVSEFVPGDTSSITNRVFTMNLVTLKAMAKTAAIPGWVWWSDKYRELYPRWSNSIYSKTSLTGDAEFEAMWKKAHDDAVVICDDAAMTLNRSVTAAAIALLGFNLLNADSGGRLGYLYMSFCNAVRECLREMSRLVTDVSSMGRFLTSLKSGWSAMEGRYSKLASDRVFAYSDKFGFVIDHHMLHGLLIDSKRIDQSRLGNPATVGMILEGEGFSLIADDKIFRGRYHITLHKFLKKDWAYDMSRLTKLMDCSCGPFLISAVDTQ
jgi:hypothetical protein